MPDSIDSIFSIVREDHTKSNTKYEMFYLDCDTGQLGYHGLFSSTRILLNDISRILVDGKDPPDSRSPAEFLGMPEGSKTALYWKIRE